MYMLNTFKFFRCCKICLVFNHIIYAVIIFEQNPIISTDAEIKGPNPIVNRGV